MRQFTDNEGRRGWRDARGRPPGGRSIKKHLGGRQASWQITVETAQNLLTTAQNITDPGGDLTGDIGRAVLASLHGPRRPRVCARKV